MYGGTINTINLNTKIINNIMSNENNIRDNINITETQLEDIANNITLFSYDLGEGIDKYLIKEKINMKQYNSEWKIDYIFKYNGIYQFQIIFNNIEKINTLEGFF